MPTGLIVAFIILGIVLIATIALWIVFGNKHRAIKKQRKLEAQMPSKDEPEGGN